MTRKRSKNPFGSLEAGLQEGQRRYINCNPRLSHRNKILVERIVRKIVQAMKKEDPAFAKLKPKSVGAGSSYERLKIGQPDEYDINLLLSLPDAIEPMLMEGTIPGCVQLKLQNFHASMQACQPQLYRALQSFVDEKDFLLTTELKYFVQSVFDSARNHFIPSRDIIVVGKHEFKISKVQNLGPALTLSINGLNVDFKVSIDLVPCIALNKSKWPQSNFCPNPFKRANDFVLVPKKPKRDHAHIDQFFRLSFRIQEMPLLYNRYHMKPTIRIMKQILQKHFKQKVSSYAIKTLFLWELDKNNALHDRTTGLWKTSFGTFLIHMLEQYLKCLSSSPPKIPYFWYSKLNLLDNVKPGNFENYRNQVGKMLNSLKMDPSPQNMLSYLTPVED